MMLMKNPSDTRKRRNAAAADLVEFGAAVAAAGGGASDGDAWDGLQGCHLGCNVVKDLILLN